MIATNVCTPAESTEVLEKRLNSHLKNIYQCLISKLTLNPDYGSHLNLNKIDLNLETKNAGLTVK